MEFPTPPKAVVALAALLRDRLSDVSGALAPPWTRGDEPEVLPADHPVPGDRNVVAAARQLALVIVGATAPFASTSYSRARLVRQMHASGLLTDEHVRRAERVLDADPGERS